MDCNAAIPCYFCRMNEGVGQVDLHFEEDFFEREVRCDFEISEMMKRAWAAEMEVLKVVVDVCEKNKLTYYADGGTLLGAVRHKGYIPWDDDIDLAMKREDYNQLIHVLPEQLPNGFVMAGMYATDEHLRKAGEVQHIRVIADETYWTLSEYMRRFHGFPYPRIGIDIFSLDYMTRDKEAFDVQMNILNHLLGVIRNYEILETNSELEIELKYVEQVTGLSINRLRDIKNQLWKIVDAVCSMYTAEEADEVTNFIFYLMNDTYKMNKQWYDEVVYMPFENTMIAVPGYYHGVLTSEYGDYTVPVQDGGMHEYPFYSGQEMELKRIFEESGITTDIEQFCRNWCILNKQ